MASGTGGSSSGAGIDSASIVSMLKAANEAVRALQGPDQSAAGPSPAPVAPPATEANGRGRTTQARHPTPRPLPRPVADSGPLPPLPPREWLRGLASTDSSTRPGEQANGAHAPGAATTIAPTNPHDAASVSAQRAGDARPRPPSQQPAAPAGAQAHTNASSRAASASSHTSQPPDAAAPPPRSSDAAVPPPRSSDAALLPRSVRGRHAPQPHARGRRGPAAHAAGDRAPPPLGPDCLICTEPIATVAVGACGHEALCAECCLKMRLCYDNGFCPVCKAPQRTVALLPWSAPLRFDPALLQPAGRAPPPPPPGFVHDSRWARGVFVQRCDGGALVRQLKRHTGVFCGVCDAGGEQPFASLPSLARHVDAEHGLHLCAVCIESGRFFARDLQMYTDEQLTAHMLAAHCECEFCSLQFFEADALHAHMNLEHSHCHVCQAAGVQHRYFRSIGAVWSHMTQEHYACTEPECEGALVAFQTEAELRMHRIAEHSRRMLPIDRSRARVLTIEPQYMHAHAAAGQRRGRRDRSAPGSTAPPPPGESHHNGLVMFDDAEGTHLGDLTSFAGGLLAAEQLSNAAAFPELPSRPDAAPGRAPRPREFAHSRPEFPTLEAAVAAAAAPAHQPAEAPADAPRPAAARQHKQLVRVEVTCPCGNKRAGVVVEEGTEPKKLECDSRCHERRRQAQLSSAFGIDLEQHTPAFAATHHVDWPLELILKARADIPWTEATEAKLAAFAVDDSKKTLTVAGLSRPQVALLEALAPEYGIVPRQLAPLSGLERLQLLKGASVKLPTVPLGKHSKLLTEADIERLHADVAASTFVLRLYDIESAGYVRKAFREWAPKMEFKASADSTDFDTALLTFPDQRSLKGAIDRFGGGVKGAFLIDQKYGRVAASGGGGGPGASSRAAGPAET